MTRISRLVQRGLRWPVIMTDSGERHGRILLWEGFASGIDSIPIGKAHDSEGNVRCWFRTAEIDVMNVSKIYSGQSCGN